VVRALDPHIGARVALADGSLLGVHRAAVAAPGIRAGGSGDGVAAPPANGIELCVSARDGRLLLDCQTGTLELLVVQPAGGRAMDAGAYLRGHELPGRR